MKTRPGQKVKLTSYDELLAVPTKAKEKGSDKQNERKAQNFEKGKDVPVR